MKILNAVLPLVCILCFSSANAQKIYSVNSSYQADVKVFVVEHEYQADLIVYKTDKDYRAKKGSVSLSVSEASSLKPVDLR